MKEKVYEVVLVEACDVPRKTARFNRWPNHGNPGSLAGLGPNVFQHAGISQLTARSTPTFNWQDRLIE